MEVEGVSSAGLNSSFRKFGGKLKERNGVMMEI